MDPESTLLGLAQWVLGLHGEIFWGFQTNKEEFCSPLQIASWWRRQRLPAEVAVAPSGTTDGIANVSGFTANSRILPFQPSASQKRVTEHHHLRLGRSHQVSRSTGRASSRSSGARAPQRSRTPRRSDARTAGVRAGGGRGARALPHLGSWSLGHPGSGRPFGPGSR